MEGTKNASLPSHNPRKHQNPPSNAVPSKEKKVFDHAELQQSKYYRVRAILKSLRPFFLEVLLNPDLRNSKAADTIQREIRFMMDYSKKTRTESVSMGKRKAEESGEAIVTDGHHQEKFLKVEQGETPTATKGEKSEGTNIVGSSPVGWNYVTSPGSPLMYYGKTKPTIAANEPGK